LAHGVCILDGPVVALHQRTGLEALEMAAWLQGGEGVLEEVGPVNDAAREPASVDVVEGVGGKVPVYRVVFDFAGRGSS